MIPNRPKATGASVVVRCPKCWNGRQAPATATLGRHSMAISGAREFIAVESRERRNPRNLHKLRNLLRVQTRSPPAMRLLKLMKDQVGVAMTQSGDEIVVGMIVAMILNLAEAHRPKPPLHPRRHRRLPMRRHLRAALTGPSGRCQHASFGPPCLTMLRNE